MPFHLNFFLPTIDPFCKHYILKNKLLGLFKVNYSENARLYVTGSKDGDVKVWDGISNRCIETFQRAHDGAQICSATFTRNGKVNLLA